MIFSAGVFGQTKEHAPSCKAINPGPASADLARAMAIPARDIDSSLPSQCIADWLMATFGNYSFAWGLSNCEKSTNGKAQANADTPKCLVADGESPNVVILHVRIEVGTASNWVSGKPVFKTASVSGCGRSKDVVSLSELKWAVQYVNEGCRK
jgi:hypothetical protein